MDDRIRLGNLGRIRRPRRTGEENSNRRDGETDSEDVEEEGDETEDGETEGRQRELPPGKGKNLDVDT